MTASIVPTWLRWLLLVPGALLCGFTAGYFVHIVNTAQAESPNAPIVFIGEFLAGLASNLVAIHVAHWFAPSHEKAVVVVFVSVAVAAGLATLYVVVQEADYPSVLLVAGNLVACYVAWRKYVSQVTR